MKTYLSLFASLFIAFITLPFITGCAGVTLSTVTTTAESLIGQGTAYVESIANMLATAAPKITTLATDIQQEAALYGLLPASSSQATTFAKVITVMQTVGTDAVAAASLVNSMQATGVIPTVATTGTTTSLQWETSHGTVYFTRDASTGRSLFYSLPTLATN